MATMAEGRWIADLKVMTFNINKTGFIRIVSAICLSLSLFCCKFFNNAPLGNTENETSNNTGEEPSYTLKITWESDTELVEEGYTVMDEGAVYLFDGAAPDSYLMGSVLVKLDAQTGDTLWKTEMSNAPGFASPVVIENHVYVFVSPNTVFCFNKQNGEFAAKALLDIDNQSMEIYWGFTGYENFLYFGIGNNYNNNYFARVDTNNIQRDGGQTEQRIEPEIVWRPVHDRSIMTKPAFHNGVVYIHTEAVRRDGVPVELAGINMTTKAVEFYREFGLWSNGEYYDIGWDFHSLYVRDDILYYIGSSISAYDLKTAVRDQLYVKTFTPGITPQKEFYDSGTCLDVTFYNGRIYYTSGAGNPFADHDYRNIHCIDAKSGNLIWNDISVNSESHGTNPIIAHNRMYVPEGNGMRVYDPETGRLIGVDKNFIGVAIARNFLYNDLMITTMRYRLYIDGKTRTAKKLVAIDVSGVDP
jgi:outer membrane protein assembly factor BamB